MAAFNNFRFRVQQLSTTCSNCHSQDLDDALSAKLAMLVQALQRL